MTRGPVRGHRNLFNIRGELTVFFLKKDCILLYKNWLFLQKGLLHGFYYYTSVAKYE